MFTQSPWLGVGFGQFVWHHFQLLPILQSDIIVGLYNNAHNLFFQVAAETGLAGLLVLFVSLGIWLYGLRSARLEAPHWWGYSMLGVLAIHSMLEYPLWYTYFVAVAAILLGMFDETRYNLEMRKVGRLSMAAILVLGLTLLFQLKVGYRELEQLLTMRPSKADRDAVIRLRDGLVSVHDVVLLSPYSELSLSALIDVSEEHINEKLSLNTRVLHFVPIGPVVYRQVLLLAQANQLEQAKTMLKQAIWSYPTEFVRVQMQIGKLAEKDPEHFSALLEFGLKEAVEYHNAVHKQ